MGVTPTLSKSRWPRASNAYWSEGVLPISRPTERKSRSAEKEGSLLREELDLAR